MEIEMASRKQQVKKATAKQAQTFEYPLYIT